MQLRAARTLASSLMLAVSLSAVIAVSGSSSSSANAATSASGTSSGASKSPIVIGDLVTLTTGNALTGREEETGRQMAVKDINAAGGIKGHPIKLVTEDVAFDTQTAINALEKVMGSNPSVIIGPVWSNEVLAMEPGLAKDKVPMLYAGSAGSVTKKGNPYIFRDLTDVSYAEPALAQWFLHTVHATKPAIIYSSDAFGISLKDAVVAGLKQIGVTPVTVQSLDDGATNVSAQMTTIQQSGADAIFGEDVSSTGALVLNTRNQLGMNIPTIMANPILAGSVLKLIPTQALQGVYVESNYSPTLSTNPAVMAWVKRYEQQYKSAPTWAEAVNYGTVQLLAHVIGKYGSQPVQILHGLQKTHYKGLFTTYYDDGEGNLWHTDDVVRFGANKSVKLVKEIAVTK